MKTTGWTAALLLGSTMLWAQASQPSAGTGHGHTTPQAGAKSSEAMPAGCQQMMERHKQMAGEMEKMDARLSELARKMNEAKGDARLDATVALVNEMVEQRQRMRERMAAMTGMMAGHAMRHMAASGQKVQCPMMSMGTNESASADRN